MPATRSHGSKNAETHYYVVSSDKKPLEIQRAGKFDAEKQDVLGEVPATVMENLGKKMHHAARPNPEKHKVCIDCKSYYMDCCKEHPHFWVQNIPKVEGQQAVPYSDSSVPKKWFKISDQGTVAGFGIIAKRRIPTGLIFGPYVGVETAPARCAKPGYAWEVKRNGKMINIDRFDKEKTNWIRYVNSPNEEADQNMLAFARGGQIYYKVIKSIPKDKEALVWYGDE